MRTPDLYYAISQGIADFSEDEFPLDDALEFFDSEQRIAMEQILIDTVFEEITSGRRKKKRSKRKKRRK